MVRRDHMTSLVALTKRALARMALRWGRGYPHATGSLAAGRNSLWDLAVGCDTLWADDGPLMLLGEHSEGIPFLLINQKVKGELTMKISKGRGFIKFS